MKNEIFLTVSFFICMCVCSTFLWDGHEKQYGIILMLLSSIGCISSLILLMRKIIVLKFG